MIERTASAVNVIVGLFALALSACNQTAAQTEFTTQAKQGLVAVADWKSCRQQTREKVEFHSLAKYFTDFSTGQFTIEQLSNESLPTPEEARIYAKYYDESSVCFANFLSQVSQSRPDLLATFVETQDASKLAVLSLVKRQTSWGTFSQKMSDINKDTQEELLAKEAQYKSNLEAENQEELTRRREAALIYLHAMQNQQMINAVNRPVVTNCNAYGTSVNCVSQ